MLLSLQQLQKKELQYEMTAMIDGMREQLLSAATARQQDTSLA